MTGIHIFTKDKEIEFEEELIGIALISILSWKKLHGRIELYTNKEYLKSLEKYGIDKLYDRIDTETLSNLPENIDYEKYWAFSKIYIASKLEPPFVILDNDLWIREPLIFDESKSFIPYHLENWDNDFEDNPYPDFDQMIPEKWLGRWDKSVLPTNTALLYLNDKELIRKWYEASYEIASKENQVHIEDNNNSIRMCFIEQRLLPMIARENNLTYSTFISQVYQSHLSWLSDGSEWFPNPSTWDSKSRQEFDRIKHVWGMKKFFDIPEVKSVVVSTLLKDMQNYDTTEFRDIKILLSRSVLPALNNY